MEDILQLLVEEYLSVSEKSKREELFAKIVKQLQPFLSTRARYIVNLVGTDPVNSFEDIMQDLQIVLLQRLEKYSKNRGKFITYMFNSMRGDPTDTLQRMCKKKRGGDGKNKYCLPISLNQFIGDSEDIELLDTVEDKSESELNHKILREDVAVLDKTNRKKLYSYLKKR